MYRPLGDRLLIEPLDVTTQTKGGLYIPETADREKPQRGKVLAAGEGDRTESGDAIPMLCKRGDIVLFGAYAGVEVKIHGQSLIVLRDRDVLLVEVADEDGPGN